MCVRVRTRARVCVYCTHTCERLLAVSTLSYFNISRRTAGKSEKRPTCFTTVHGARFFPIYISTRCMKTKLFSFHPPSRAKTQCDEETCWKNNPRSPRVRILHNTIYIYIVYTRPTDRTAGTSGRSFKYCDFTRGCRIRSPQLYASSPIPRQPPLPPQSYPTTGAAWSRFARVGTIRTTVATATPSDVVNSRFF